MMMGIYPYNNKLYNIPNKPIDKDHIAVQSTQTKKYHEKNNTIMKMNILQVSSLAVCTVDLRSKTILTGTIEMTMSIITIIIGSSMPKRVVIG